VNENDVKDLLTSGVAHPGVDSIDIDAVLRGGRRRQRIRTATTFGSVLVVLALVGSVAFAGRPHPGPSPVVADPSTLTVVCSPNGITVSSDAVAATGAGVVVSLSSTMAPGASLNYRWPGSEGNEPMTREPTSATLPAPPGPLTLSCSGLRGAVPAGGAHTVTVTDPHHVWSSSTMPDLGCTFAWPQTLPARRPGSGSTPEAAVSDYLAMSDYLDGTLRRGGAPEVSVARMHIGYADAVSQRWLVSLNGVPTLAVAVDPTGTTYSARLDTRCTPAAASPSSSG
jgi:hypothetical protein